MVQIAVRARSSGNAARPGLLYPRDHAARNVRRSGCKPGRAIRAESARDRRPAYPILRGSAFGGARRSLAGHVMRD